jgi:hypothetical protein
MKRILVIVGAAGVLLSCENGTVTEYSGTYKSKVLEVSSIRVFTAKGEVTDAAVVKGFVKRRQSSTSFFYADGNHNADGKMEIAFLTDRKAQVTTSKGYDARTVIGKGSDIYLEAYTTTVRMNKDAEPLVDKLVTFFPPNAVTTSLAATTGYYSKTEYKHCYFAKQSGDAVRFPQLSYLYVKVGADKKVVKKEETQLVNNVLNGNVASKLSDGDTLAVQQSYLVLQKL